MTDFVAAAVLPSFANLLLDEAPSTTISVINCNESNARELLDAREIDLAVGLFRDQEQWLEKEALFEEEHRCVFNRALIPADVPFPLEQFIAAPHLLVTQAGDLRGFLYDILARQSEKRTVLISGPYFLLTGYLLRYLPMISVLPKHYAECCCSASGLAISPLPFEGPISTISTPWRSRNARSSKTRFLRTLLQRSVTVKDVREGSKCNAPA